MLSHRLAPDNAAEIAGHGDDHGHHADDHHAAGHEDHAHATHDEHHPAEPSPHSESRMRACELITTGLLAVSCLLSWVVFIDVGFRGGSARVPIMEWIHVGGLQADWFLRIDTLTAVML